MIVSLTKAKPRRNLSREDWIREAIDLLAKEGIGAITIGALSSRLQITQGSFYHHFIRSGRGITTATAEVQDDAGERHLRELLDAILVNRHSALVGARHHA